MNENYKDNFADTQFANVCNTSVAQIGEYSEPSKFISP